MSLGKDLASIRKNKNLSLEDIQNAVKIPIDTLESIEDDSIFSDPSKNKTYIRSFVRSYAKVLKIEDEKIVQALDEVEEGNYSGSIFKKDTSAPQESTPNYGTTLDFKPSADDDFTVDDAPEPAQPKITSQVETSPAPAPAPATDSINWADMGKKFSAANTNSKIWIVTAAITVFVIIVGSGIIFSDNIASLFSPDSSEAQQEVAEDLQSEQTLVPTAADSADNNSQAPPTEPETESPTNTIPLGDTLTIDLYAAYDKLDPIRITSDLNWQTNPFWMEQGQAFKFDFRDSLIIRGQYGDFLLLFNGHVIENPRQNYFDTTLNSILITRSILNQPTFLAPPPEEFPLDVGAPDSSTYRIRF